jgi:hypothetical protein
VAHVARTCIEESSLHPPRLWGKGTIHHTNAVLLLLPLATIISCFTAAAAAAALQDVAPELVKCLATKRYHGIPLLHPS